MGTTFSLSFSRIQLLLLAYILLFPFCLSVGFQSLYYLLNFTQLQRMKKDGKLLRDEHCLLNTIYYKVLGEEEVESGFPNKIVVPILYPYF